MLTMIKKIQSTDSIETYEQTTSENIIPKNVEIKCRNKIKQYKNYWLQCCSRNKTT